MSSRADIELTPAQHRFVSAKGHVLALACPGSGKTASLARRAAQLLAATPTGRVAAATFGRAAAIELRSRVFGMVPGSAQARFTCGTFHSLALGQLKATASKALRVLTTEEQRSLLRRARDSIGLLLDDETALIWVESAKRGRAGAAHPNQLRLLDAYQQMLVHLGALDFADLLRLAVHGMDAGTLAPLPVQHFLVDEFQDADELQHEWVDRHIANGAITSAVADDDQSIYGWRNALGYQGLEDFRLRHGAEVIVLDQNFRSHSEVVTLAGSVIARNTQRMEKTVRSARGSGGSVAVRSMPSVEAEVESIRSALSQDPAGWCVIARTNSVLDKVQLELEAHEIPFRRLGGDSFWDAEGPSALASLLDSVAGTSALGAEHALAFAKSDPSLLHSLHLDGLLRESGRPMRTGDKLVDQFTRLLAGWRTSARAQRTAEVITDCGAWLVRNAPRKSMRPSIEVAGAALLRVQGPLSRRLRTLSRGDKSKGETEDAVVLCTMHTSKGLEFDRVWILGLHRGGCPHENAADIEEERRLLYVGMTRARKDLVISGASAPHGVSPFLKEVQANIEWRVASR